MDGTLLAVPQPRGYEESKVRPGDPAYGMAPLPRVAEYRGFVFASLSQTGPTLQEYLGPIASSIDDMVDRAPEGEIEVAGGVARHLYHGNWKLVSRTFAMACTLTVFTSLLLRLRNSRMMLSFRMVPARLAFARCVKMGPRGNFGRIR